MSFSSKLPSVHDFNWILFSQALDFWEMNMKGMAGTGAVGVNRAERAPLKAVEKMKKIP